MAPQAQPHIHPAAVVDPTASLADDVRVGPYAIVGPRAALGPGCVVEAHAVIGPLTTLGARNRVHHHAVVGTDSQDGKFQGEEAYLTVGDDNIFREFVTVNRATGQGKATRIGNGCRLLAYAHVAHNTVLEDGVILANCAEVGGECYIGRHAILGGLVGVHQFCRIGAHTIVGACSKVTHDILPCMTADGHPARPRGINAIGLRRHGFSEEAIAGLKDAYLELFARGHRFEEGLEILRAQQGNVPEVREILDFVAASQRGVARPRRLAEEDPL